MENYKDITGQSLIFRETMEPYRFILFTFLCLTFQSVIAQKKPRSVKEIKVTNNYEKGTIRDGFKKGIWEYYDRPGELSLSVNYDNGQITYLKTDTAGVYAIEKSGVWTQSNLTIQPRYLGSLSEFYTILIRNIRFPTEAKNNATAGTVYIMFEVDTNGKADNFTIVKDIGNNCAEEVIKAFKLIPNLWIVASKNRMSYKSRFILPVTFGPLKGADKELIEFPVSRLLSEVRVEARVIVR